MPAICRFTDLSFAFYGTETLCLLLCFTCVEQGNLPISKEVNRKKSEEEGECLVPENGYERHFTKINYLYSY
ncbi:hypothetical protein BTVI_05265 [Pitangus sulphuratus]|nr:hypothetical protein BTVI_05265 [Pitangus sulphuratus]